jgi:hypothetical protein
MFLQVHQSKVSSILFVTKGTCLLTGCDAAAPSLDGPKDGPALVLVSCKVGRLLSRPAPRVHNVCHGYGTAVLMFRGSAGAAPALMQDGSTQQRAERMPACNVRLLLPAPDDAGHLLCVSSDGRLLLLDIADLTVQAAGFLPGTPAEADAAAPAPSVPAEQEYVGEPCSSATSASGQASGDEDTALPLSPPVSLAALGPEFEPSIGYRGPRQAPAACGKGGCSARLWNSPPG